MRNARRVYWRLCYLGAVLLSVITFTPLVIPPGKYTPTLAGMPRTLWLGILIAAGLVVLTFIASRVSPTTRTEGSEDE